MKAEIDQSGKVEYLNTHTVVSLANHVSGSIYLSVTEKIRLIKTLRSSVFNRTELIYTIFAVIVAILVIRFGKNLTKVEIDEEYSGKDKPIREIINKLLINSKCKNVPKILFVRVGKLSPAHKLAWKIHRLKMKKKALVLKAEDVLSYFKLK